MTTDAAVRASGLPGVALAVSLLMHAALLLLPIDASPRRAALTERAAGTILRLVLLPSAVANTTRVLPSRAPATTATRAAPPAAPSTRPARAERSARRASQASVDVPPPPVAPRDEPTPATLAPDALRAQVRDAIRQGAKAPFGPATEAPSEGDAPTLFDRPLLDALARRVGRPLQVTREQRLADGSWRIRFAGGVCMHVPRELPVALDNAFGPNIALTTNCSD